MSQPLHFGGPVSAALEAELRNRVRQRGIVVWLDLDGHYTGFAGRLAAVQAAGRLPYRVDAFRGSFLELKLKLEQSVSGREMPRLVVHLPGFNEESVRSTPLLELYLAGARFRKALATLVTDAASGHVRPEQIAAFLRPTDGLSLEAADDWLGGLLAEPAGGLAARLRPMRLPAVVDELLAGGFGREGVQSADGLSALWSYLAAKTGITEAWRSHVLPTGYVQVEDVAFGVTAWALAVEYVHDLRRAPVEDLLQPLAALPPGVVEECRQLASHLRERQREFYRRTAGETESLLAEEIEAARAEDLGRIDTFRFEEEKVLAAALARLQEHAWEPVARWAEPRLAGGSFWLSEDPARRSAWQLVADTARLGQTIDRAGPRLGAKHGLESALERYTELGAAVDQAHRHLEQHRLTLLYPQLPAFEALRSRLDDARALWRDWADGWARDFSALCRAEGFLPQNSLQQRTLFDDVVRPLAQDGTTALFLVDALRYEMAEELYRAVSGTAATSAHLRARLAELPTVTQVGMNVLPPLASGGT
ncbi:MAG TPA: BREX-6 system phosphatase PglZ, partial [Longimicrobiaceae bacterium]|nr:BREX-6 system phosphatase PglZ [Longimicrobiaceae bacterium]